MPSIKALAVAAAVIAARNIRAKGGPTHTEGGGGGGVCPITLSTELTAAFGALPPTIDGQRISHTVPDSSDFGSRIAHTYPPAAFWSSGKRVVEGKTTVFTRLTGQGQNSLIILNGDGSRILLVGFTGANWIYRLMVGGSAVHGISVAGAISDIPAIGVDPETRNCFAYLNGVQLTTGAFGPGGAAEGWLTGAACMLAADIASQSTGSGDMEIVTAADDFAFTYAGASDWCGNPL